MEKVICNAPRGKAKTSRFALIGALVRKVATSATLPAVLALAGAAGTAFADTAINLANSLSTVEGVYTVEGTVVTLVKTNETYNLSGSRYVKGCDSTTYQPETTEENSTITIHLGGREVHNKERLVAWYEQPENVTFVLDEESRNRTKCRIAVKEDGIYVVRKGLVVIVR